MFERIKKIVFSIDDGVEMIGNVCIVFNMAIVTISILMRVFFKSPIAGLTDIVGLVSGVIIALTIAFTEKEGGHISADFIMEYFPKTVQKISYVAVNLMSNAVVAVLGWRLFVYAQQAYEGGTASWVVNIPLFPVAFLISMGMFLFFLTSVVKCIDRIIHWEKQAK